MYRLLFFYFFCVENKAEVTSVALRKWVPCAFINVFVLTDCIIQTHSVTAHTHTQMLLIQSDPALGFAPPICPYMVPIMHDVMAALEIKTNTATLPVSAFLKHALFTYSQIKRGRGKHIQARTCRGRRPTLIWLQESYRGMSTGTGSVRRETDCVTLGGLKNWGCTSVLVREETARLMFQPSQWWGLKTAACVCVHRRKNHFIKPQTTWLRLRSKFSPTHLQISDW